MNYNLEKQTDPTIIVRTEDQNELFRLEAGRQYNPDELCDHFNEVVLQYTQGNMTDATFLGAVGALRSKGMEEDNSVRLMTSMARRAISNSEKLEIAIQRMIDETERS